MRHSKKKRQLYISISFSAKWWVMLNSAYFVSLSERASPITLANDVKQRWKYLNETMSKFLLFKNIFSYQKIFSFTKFVKFTNFAKVCQIFSLTKTCFLPLSVPYGRRNKSSWKTLSSQNSMTSFLTFKDASRKHFTRQSNVDVSSVRARISDQCSTNKKGFSKR